MQANAVGTAPRSSTPTHQIGDTIRRSADVVLAGVGLLLLSPLLVIVSLAVGIASGRPILFSQVRVGKDFRPFRIWKFRSMRQEAGAQVTTAGDKRITWIGGILRRTKLDELPQLWNVVVGDMSLVGPRPEVPSYVEAFRDRFSRVLTVRPGLTDVATLEFPDEELILALEADPILAYRTRILPAKLQLSEQYIRERTLSRDALILLRTAGMIAARLTQRTTHK